MTPHFIGEEPCVQFLPDGRNVRVIEHPIRFVDSRGVEWVAPIGTETDGASIPQLFWNIVAPFTGEYRDAAILHDAAYQLAPARESSFHLADLSTSRMSADRMLLEASLSRGTPTWKAYAIWISVRLGGGFAWRGHARENAKDQKGA